MPLINVFTSKENIPNADEFLSEISTLMSSLTGKPEKYVMTILQNNALMSFGGAKEPCCYIEIKSIGAINSSEMSKIFCKVVSERIGIPSNRIYIRFEDVPAKSWGWDGRTFG